jgi:hypothetical protein
MFLSQALLRFLSNSSFFFFFFFFFFFSRFHQWVFKKSLFPLVSDIWVSVILGAVVLLVLQGLGGAGSDGGAEERPCNQGDSALR